MKHEMKRKGFTLVELLIVIVVIGILSAMMMLSSTEAVTSANASNIVSNFRNLKTAALAWYVDNLDYIEKTAATTANGINMNNDTTANRKGIISYLNSSSATAFNFNFVGTAYADDTPAAGTSSNTYKSGGFTYGIEVQTRTDGGDTLADAKWYLTCVVPDKKVREKLAGRAKSVGILKNKSASDTETYYQTSDLNETTVYYLVR